MVTSMTGPPDETLALPDGLLRFVLAAALDRVIPEDNYPSATEAGVMNFIERNAGAGFGSAWPLLLSGLDDLDAEARSRGGIGFALLAPDEQDQVLAAVEHGDVTTTWHVDPAGFFETLVSIAADGFYADPGNGGNRGSISWSMVGYPAPVAPRSTGRLPAVVRSHREVRDRYDVVVVGAGAGGGVVAYVLASAGLEVLVVERGDALGTDQVPPDHLRNHRLARCGHNTGPSLSGNPRVLVTDEGPQVLSPSDPGWNNVAMTLGGGTRVWGAQAWRMSPIDFRMATTYGEPDGSTLADWPISYEDLEPYYDRAEWALGVAGEPGHAHAGHRSRGYPLPPVRLGTTGHRLAAGAERLGWPTAAVPLMINTAPFGGRSACVRCSQCIGFACPVDAKTGAHNSVLADAVASGHCTVLVGYPGGEGAHWARQGGRRALCWWRRTALVVPGRCGPGRWCSRPGLSRRPGSCSFRNWAGAWSAPASRATPMSVLSACSTSRLPTLRARPRHCHVPFLAWQRGLRRRRDVGRRVRKDADVVLAHGAPP